MREKLLDLMKYEGLKPSQLAELLEINPAGISHILAGRNKPGFDLLQKILRRFPRINPDWLLLDSGKMYRDDVLAMSHATNTATTQTQPTNEDLFGSSEIMGGSSKSQKPTANPENTIPSQMASNIISNPNSTVNRIVIFYDDQTFESYTRGK